MGAPLLSIVVPHHDRPDFLAELVESIPEIDEIEIIVVDDHSTEYPNLSLMSHRCLQLLDLPDDRRFAGSARNYGLQHTSGTWVTFADSDDLFDTAELAQTVRDLLSLKEDLIYVRSTSFRADGRPGTRHIAVNELLDLAQAGDPAALVQFYPPWAKFIRRSLLVRKNVQFEPVQVSNDVMFSARLFLATKEVRILDRYVYRIREGNPSLTSNVSPERISTRIEVLHRYNALLAESGLRGYRAPAAGQIFQIARKHPVAAAIHAMATLKRGQPVFLTAFHLRKHLRRLSAGRS